MRPVVDLANFSVPSVGAIFPGACVAIHALNGNSCIGLIVAVYEKGTRMTDIDGEQRPWTGIMPIIDVVIVDPDNAKKIPKGISEPWSVQPVRLAKVCWQGDLERQAKLFGLPNMIVRSATRYTTIDKVVGS